MLRNAATFELVRAPPLIVGALFLSWTCAQQKSASILFRQGGSEGDKNINDQRDRNAGEGINQTFLGLRLIVLMALATGMRIDEIFGLWWCDLLHKEGLDRGVHGSRRAGGKATVNPRGIAQSTTVSLSEGPHSRIAVYEGSAGEGYWESRSAAMPYT